MLQTNCPFLENDIMDVLRLFGAEEEDFTHYFSYSYGTFFNAIEYDGEFYDSEEKYNPEDELEYKRYARRYAKLAFYNLLSQKKNKKMPWGALTGIRPTKLAYMEQEEKRNFEELFQKMGVCEENTKLIAQVLEGQKGIYTTKGGQDLFISLPFCPTKCEYCSFITAPIAATKKFMPQYLDALEKELLSIKPLLTDCKSVYIGGGTPFVLEVEELRRVYEAVKAVIPQNVEYTVEAGRPDVFSKEKLALSAAYGVTRICVNPQSFHDSTLVSIGRKHTKEDVYNAYAMAKEYPFLINCDLIAGLAEESVEEFASSVQQAIDLGFDNITVHTLCLKAGAKLKEQTKTLNGEGIAEMMAISRKLLSENGYTPYYLYRQKYQAGGGENVGWTKQGKACIYNVDTMEELCDNIAVGAGAVSKRVFVEEGRIERLGTPKDLKTYLEKIDKIIEDRIAFYTTEE